MKIIDSYAEMGVPNVWHTHLSVVFLSLRGYSG